VTKFVHGRVIKLDDTEPLNLEEAEEEVQRLLTKYRRREKRRFSHGQVTPEANTDEIQRYIDMAERR
jgi:hypothetical protein